MENFSRKSLNCARTIITLWLLASCGLPTNFTVLPPDIITTGVNGNFSFRLEEGHGFVIYYRALPSGQTFINEDFSTAMQTGLAVFTARQYLPAASHANSANLQGTPFIWLPANSGSFSYPITVETSFDGAQLAITIRDNFGTVIFNDAVIRGNAGLANRNFAQTMATAPDMANITGGTITLAFAVMNFRLNYTTLTLYPSIAMHLGYLSPVNLYN
ncbi:MAG: hypothetical protein FWE37_06095 [Spirochaetaceae bacterium]|nr:hypothetical protein [Spirochaetaceae bacterium]